MCVKQNLCPKVVWFCEFKSRQCWDRAAKKWICWVRKIGAETPRAAEGCAGACLLAHTEYWAIAHVGFVGSQDPTSRRSQMSALSVMPVPSIFLALVAAGGTTVRGAMNEPIQEVVFERFLPVEERGDYSSCRSELQ
jgi:hypothetical protein